MLKRRVLDSLHKENKLKFKEADFIELEVRAAHLSNMDLGGVSDPYFIIYRYEDKLISPEKKGKKRKKKKITRISDIGKDKVKKVVYKSEAKMNTLKPYWNIFRVSLDALCGSNPDTRIVFEVFRDP